MTHFCYNGDSDNNRKIGYGYYNNPFHNEYFVPPVSTDPLENEKKILRELPFIIELCNCGASVDINRETLGKNRWAQRKLRENLPETVAMHILYIVKKQWPLEYKQLLSNTVFEKCLQFERCILMHSDWITHLPLCFETNGISWILKEKGG